METQTGFTHSDIVLSTLGADRISMQSSGDDKTSEVSEG